MVPGCSRDDWNIFRCWNFGTKPEECAAVISVVFELAAIPGLQGVHRRCDQGGLPIRADGAEVRAEIHSGAERDTGETGDPVEADLRPPWWRIFRDFSASKGGNGGDEMKIWT